MYQRLLYCMMAAAFALAAVAPVTDAQVTNLVKNPSFEEDEVILDDPAWEQWATWGWEGGLNSVIKIDETQSVDGKRSLRIEPQGGTNWYFIVLYLPIPTTINTKYTASFWVKAEAPRALTAKWKATDNTVDWGLTDFQVTTEWAEYSLTAPAQSAETKLEFHCAAVDTPFWLDFVNVYEGDYVAGILPSGTGSPEKAAGPKPADGAVIDPTWATLTWRAGSTAATHWVYFGESFDAVDQGEMEPVPTMDTTLSTARIPAYAAGLTQGRVYYWRVDEVNDADPGSPWKGDVWSFRVRPVTAWNPTPGNGWLYVDPNQDLTWEHGTGYLFHTVYFGESFDQVSNATTGGWMSLTTVYDPKTMKIGTTYYWRVDEFTGKATNKGEVWSFTTVPSVAVGDPDLLGWWTLDEGMGTTAVDWSGHGKHGQIIGDATWTYGPHGGALYLARGAHVDIPALNVSTNTVTMTAWAKRNGNQPDWAAILFKRQGSAVCGMGFGPANELRYHWTDKYWDFATGLVPPNQEWFFIALVVEPTQGTLYYNGTDTFARNRAAHDLASFDGVLRIGQDQSGRDLQGTVDDVRFYNKALSAAQLQEVMRGDVLLAWDPAPAPDAVADIRDISSLTWSAGKGAASHDVYFGASRPAVVQAQKDAPEYRGNQTGTNFSLADLIEMGGDYCWRIDEVEAGAAVHAGYTWKFSVLPYLLVDDFESYDDNKEAGTAIYQTWIDGVDNGTGSYVGYEVATNGTFGETRIVHGGLQSMPLNYDNTNPPKCSEADCTFAPAQDWTEQGVTTLTLYFLGAAGNTGQLYAKINGTKVAYNGPPDDIAAGKWLRWDIPLAPLGVDLAKVRTLTIGIEGGDKGVVYIDDVQLTKPASAGAK
jgi:hypothetical protein